MNATFKTPIVPAKKPFRASFFLSVPLQEKILFTKNLALSLKAGVSLVKSIQFLHEQTRSKSFKKILETVIDDTNRGVFLSASLQKYQNTFGELFVNIIKIGETSGNLPENLLYLGDELKKRYDLKKKVRGASIYPMVVFVATIVIAVSMIVFVFPKLLPLFTSLKVELPLTTRILIAVSSAVTNYGFYLLGGLVAFLIGFMFLMRLKPARLIYHTILLHTPILGTVMVNFNMANFSRTLGILLKSGVNIVEAVTITGNTLSNLVYQKYLGNAAGEIQRGTFLSRYLSVYHHYFPLLAVNMIEVGENTGNLTENLFYLAEYYENEVDDFVKNLSSILEPVLLIFMGFIVGFIALSFITPLYQITRSIK